MNSPTYYNRYQIKSRIGQGGMGVVYRAYDRLSGQEVALKQVINYEYQERDPLLLAHEFQILASLRHPNIIDVLDYGFNEQGTPFFTMTLLHAHQTITQAAIGRAIKERIELIIQLFEALAYLHRRHIIHRDLKPSNVLVLPNGQVKVVDFGVAISDQQARPKVVGTVLYMAPEVLLEEKPTHLSDLYSAGVLAYEVLTGEHPYQADSVTELLSAILKSKPKLDRLPTLTEQNLQNTIQLDRAAHIDLDLFPSGQLEDVHSPLNPLHVIIQRLMQKQPEHRYANANIVIDEWRAVLGQTPSLENAAIRESYLQAANFVGRQQELNTLLEGLEAILQVPPKGQSFLIGGEAGVGKSRLLDELRIRAMVKGVTVLSGKGSATGDIPYSYWRDIIRRLLLSTQITDIEASILTEIVPDIDHLLGKEIPPAPSVDASLAQTRLKETIVALVLRQTHPTIIILEDLHWALESLVPIKELTARIGQLPILIIGSYRHDERPNLPTQLPAMQTIMLERFDQETMRALCASMLGEAGHRENLLAFVQRETEGNAFFIVETMRALAQEVGRLDNIGRSPLPASIQAGGIQAVIQRRLEAVPSVHRPLLNVAAIQARQFNLTVVEAVAREYDLLVDSMNTWLQACADAAVIELKDGNWQFAHEKLRMVIIEAIPVDERRQWHRRVALAMEHKFDDLTQYAIPLLYQWREAGDTLKEAHYGLIAARQNNAKSEFSIAIAQAQRVLEILPNTSQHTSQRIEAMHILGIAYASTGQLHESETILQDALVQARQHDDLGLLILSLSELGSLLTARQQFDQAQPYLQEAIALSEKHDDLQLRANVLNNLGTLYHEQGLHQNALDHYYRSLAICRRLSYQWGIARALNNIGNVYIAENDAAQAKTFYTESLTLWRAIGSRRGVATVLNNLGVVTESLGQYEEAARYYQEGLELSQTYNDELNMAINLINLAWVLMMQKKFTQAYSHLIKALQLSDELQIEILCIFAMLGIAWAEARYKPQQAAQWYGMLTQRPNIDTSNHHFIDVYRAIEELFDDPKQLEQEIARGASLDFQQTLKSTLLKKRDTLS